MLIFKGHTVLIHSQSGFLASFPSPNGISLKVKGIIGFLLIICLFQEEPGFIYIRLTLMDAEAGTVAAFVAEIIQVENLPLLPYGKHFLTFHHPFAIFTGQLGQGNGHTLNLIGIVGPVGANLHTFITEGRAL